MSVWYTVAFILKLDWVKEKEKRYIMLLKTPLVSTQSKMHRYKPSGILVVLEILSCKL